MAISNSYDFSSSRDNIIKGALRILGVISQGQTPDATQTTDAAEALNQIVKAWASEGIPLWIIKKQSVTLSSSVGTYLIGLGQTVNIARPTRIYQAMLNNTTNGVDTPLTPLSQEEYQNLSQKTITGTPSQYYYEPLRNTGTLYLWPKPDTTTAANYTVQIVYQSPMADFDAAGDEPDLPQEGIRALKWALASELTFEFGYPSKDRNELFQRAEFHKQEFLGSIQEEASLFFKADLRG